MRLHDETVWLTQAQLCELYQSSKANVSEHIKNIFEEGELEENSVVRKIRTTAADRKYQDQTLTPVEEDYLQTIRAIEKTVKTACGR